MIDCRFEYISNRVIWVRIPSIDRKIYRSPTGRGIELVSDQLLRQSFLLKQPTDDSEYIHHPSRDSGNYQ